MGQTHHCSLQIHISSTLCDAHTSAAFGMVLGLLKEHPEKSFLQDWTDRLSYGICGSRTCISDL